ncbi:efflux RND transporter periplasmic adaptor subunit [Microvirga arabica]|uniref:Efflux RND transporter periplasmic adaptor subunit n=1 Tax=Microvirga arabica TaxID=1128671 RepID=A0ABV6Y9C2_9HYPH
MDQISPLNSLERQDPFASRDHFEPDTAPERAPPPRHGRTLKRLALTTLAATALAGGFAAGYHGGRTNWPLPGWLPAPAVAFLNGPAPAAAGPVAYYRHPDGQPAYSISPKKTEDGRDYLPVPASADVSFDDKPKDAPAGQPAADQAGGKKILYYRNPMGLPDTSPVPKKDSMGMDYIPVYEGEAEDGSTVTVSPGKLQRTGVRSEAVERRVVTRPVRAPGTVKLDERRIAVISLRSESFIDKVEDVTTGERVRKGDPLLRPRHREA